MRAALLLTALLVTAPSAAHAAGAEVHANFGVFPVEQGTAALALVECDAQAFPGDSLDVPIATTISCTVDGVEQNAVAPGPTAATAFVTVSRAAFELCLSATATYDDVLNGNVFYTVTDPYRCVHVEI